LLKSNDGANIQFKEAKNKVNSVESNCVKYRINRKNKKSCGWLMNACSDLDNKAEQENELYINEKHSMDYEEDINHMTL
jgi:hypothetical protein